MQQARFGIKDSLYTARHFFLFYASIYMTSLLITGTTGYTIHIICLLEVDINSNTSIVHTLHFCTLVITPATGDILHFSVEASLVSPIHTLTHRVYMYTYTEVTVKNRLFSWPIICTPCTHLIYFGPFKNMYMNGIYTII